MAGEKLYGIVLFLITFSLFGQNSSFPVFETKQTCNPDKGNFVFAVSPYLTILDTEGDPVFFRKTEDGVRYFQLQENGLLTYYNNVDGKFFALNTYYQVIDSFQVSGNYSTDFHSLRLLPNKHVLLMGIELQKVDMSKIVPGGKPDATVRALILQEQDSMHRIIFQWRSLDHLEITDADTSLVDLTSDVIDYVHANAFEMTPDSNFLLTARNMSAVMKISRETGEILWCFGGKNNQFVLSSGTVDIHAVHSAMLLDNTHMILFDNGTDEKSDSRGLEYLIDQEKKTATILHAWHHEPPVFTPVMGNIQKMNDSQYLIGWGKNNENLICTVYDTLSHSLIEIKPADQYPFWSYSVSSGIWKDSLLLLPHDSVFFGTLSRGDSVFSTIPVINTDKEEIILTGYTVEDHSFTCINTFPAVIPVNDTMQIHVKFHPDTAGKYVSRMMFYFTPVSVEPDKERIVRKLYLYGNGGTQTVIHDRPEEDQIKIFPDPFRYGFKLVYPFEAKKVYITDMSGRICWQSLQPKGGMNIIMKDEPAGMYLLFLLKKKGRPVTHKIIKY